MLYFVIPHENGKWKKMLIPISVVWSYRECTDKLPASFSGLWQEVIIGTLKQDDLTFLLDSLTVSMECTTDFVVASPHLIINIEIFPFFAWKTLSFPSPVLYLSQGLHSQGCFFVCVRDEKSALKNDWWEIAQCWQDMTGLCLGTFKTLWWVSAVRPWCGSNASLINSALPAWLIRSLVTFFVVLHCSKHFFLDSLISHSGLPSLFTFLSSTSNFVFALCFYLAFCSRCLSTVGSSWQWYFVMCADLSSAGCNSLHSLDKWCTHERRLVCS